MPLRVEPPEDAQGLQERVISAIGAQFGHAPTISAPYPVETAILEAVAVGEILGGLLNTPRWQCLVGDEEPAAAVDIVRDGDSYVVVSINYGELAPRLNEVVERAGRLVSPGDYELRTLEVPRLHFVAAHLVGENSDLFFPVLSSGDDPNNVQSRLYAAAELGQALRDVASQALREA